MRLSSPSLRSVALAALVACAGVAGTGCVFSDGNGGDETTPVVVDTPPATIQQMTIDADATLQAKGGDGVGVFVEYTTGGHWHVFTACDVNQPTNPDKLPCGFDVFASTLTAGSSRLSNAQGESLEAQDVVSLGGDGTVHLFTETGSGLNGMTFDADPGAVVELDVYLDNAEDPHFIYWVGDQVLHQGAPSDPLDLAPSEKPAGSAPPGK
jgi:hypothetical protein